MGHISDLTEYAANIIKNADVVYGSTRLYEQYKVLSDDSRNESDVDAVLIKPDNPENIEEFSKNMKAVIAELFREAVGLAQYVYEECFVNGKDVEEILSDDPRKTEAILATYMLFLNNGNGDVGMPS